ncbi:ANR family transcriptional regulator [Serratia bockelmannii]|uniref:ANR family transcriptional regulator n=1 Tax=Serratia bockelmannii TaxID=2703793 RepID=UPI003FA7B30D
MGTYDAYRNIARIAAECEQRGWYEKAAEAWEKSLKLARAVDVPWIKPAWSSAPTRPRAAGVTLNEQNKY